MAEQALDYFVVVDPDNVYWLTNFANYVHERPFVLVLAKDGRFRFVVPELELRHLQRRAVPEIEMLPYFEFPAPEGRNWSDCFSPLFKSGDRVGIEATCPHYVSKAIVGEILDSELLEQARYIKSDYEIARIRYSSDIATARMQAILAGAKAGQSMLSIHGKSNKLGMLQVLLDNPEMNPLATHIGTVVQPPEMSDDPHNFTDIMRLGMTENGPHVAIVNGVFNGYGTEVERTFFVGEVPDNAVRPFETMMEVRRLVYELVKPGASMHDVDKAANDHFRKRGYEHLLHRTGHSIGVTGHEGPFLAEGFHHEIRPGMLFTIEPGLYLQGIGGFRHSDTVLVTDTGNVNLTPVPDSLESMTLPSRGRYSEKKKEFSLSLMRLYAKINGLTVR